METTHHVYSSQRAIAMVLALVSAVVLSPLYIDRKFEYRNEKRRSSGFLLPVILAGLIVGIRTASSSSTYRGNRSNSLSPSSSDSSFLLTIGNSSWGLAAILIALMCILSWQSSVQQFFWR